MTRPKVDPDKRQRTATACDSCKRRKQKCDGAQPCNTCSKRSTLCEYSPPGNVEDFHSPKRRMIDLASNSSAAATPSLFHANSGDSYFQNSLKTPQWAPKQSNGTTSGSARLQEARRQSDVSDFKIPPHSNNVFSGVHGTKKHDLDDADLALEIASKGSSGNGELEELAPNPRLSMRMLQDGKGRLLYLGDSATLSFLQLIRMNVETIAGASPFTEDPKRFWIVERQSSLPANHLHTHLLPARDTANVLVESFLANTNGLIEIFHRENFMRDLDRCYADPLGVEADWLCLLNLTFAIGLVLATPLPGTCEEVVIGKLRAEELDRSEVFYLNAKHLSDPTSGFEDAGFKSIQALALMSIYTLATSRRNAAYAYYGMAVRSAFALGLHREETLSFSLFSESEQAERRNLWRTLYVLDRFLSASLGRPTAIRESDCSGDVLDIASMKKFPQTPHPEGVNIGHKASPGLAAAVSSCHIVGVILEKIYSQRKVSSRIAQKIADECKGWQKSLDPTLKIQNASSEDPAQGIAMLHVHLLYYHSIVLLTRPFFLFLMTNKNKRTHSKKGHELNFDVKYGRFAEKCVSASCDSIDLVKQAHEGGYLPRSNPFVMYFLFASTVVVLASEFSNLHRNSRATDCIHQAIKIMQYSAESDPQGQRLAFILLAFRDVVVKLRSEASQAAQQQEKGSGQYQKNPAGILLSPPSTMSPPPNSSTRNNSVVNDPMYDLARGPTNSNSGGSTDGNESADNDGFEFDNLYNQAWEIGPNFASSMAIASGGSIAFDPTTSIAPSIAIPGVPVFGTNRTGFEGR